MQMKLINNNEMPKGWTTKHFGDLFDFIKSFSFSRDDLIYQKTNGEIQYIHYGDIHAVFENEILDFNIESHIPYLKDNLIDLNDINNKDFPFLKDGDLIIADASEDYEGLAECVELKNIGNRKVISGLHTFAARVKNNNTAAGFRTYLLTNPVIKKELKRLGQGISVYSISKSHLSKVNLMLPTYKEQETIANIFSLWDKAIFLTNQKIDLKERLKKGLMQQLLPIKNIAPINRRSNYEERNLKDFLIPISREVIKPANKYLSLGIRSHCKGTFLKRDFDPEDIMLETLFEVKDGDLIVNITFAWEGAIAIAGKQNDGALVSHRFPTYTFDKIVCIPEYFKFVITTKWFVFLLGLISPGGAGRNRVLSKKDFLKLRLLIPSIDEQIRISNILETLSKEISLLKTQLELFRQQKKGLMQVLLTGKRRLQNSKENNA